MFIVVIKNVDTTNFINATHSLLLIKMENVQHNGVEEMRIKDCKILKEFEDQLISCYTNPVVKCPIFDKCTNYLLEKVREEKNEFRKKKTRSTSL